jgi:hypothetical protein
MAQVLFRRCGLAGLSGFGGVDLGLVFLKQGLVEEHLDSDGAGLFGDVGAGKAFVG